MTTLINRITFGIGYLICIGCAAQSDDVDRTLTTEPAAFVCGVGDPLSSPLPAITVGSGSPPVARGGVIAEGKYLLNKVQVFGSVSSVAGGQLEFRNGFLRRQQTVFLASSGAALTGHTEVGPYVANGNALALEGTVCNYAGNPTRKIVWEYTATGSTLELVQTTDTSTSIETFEKRE